MLKPLRFGRAAVTSLSGLLVLLAPTFAHALRTGQNFACVNCHEGQDKPEVLATFSAPRIEPGASVDITVTATHSSALIGGVLVDSHGLGAFEIVDPLETHFFEDTPTQVTHVAPKAYADGQVEFTFRWVAPDTVGPFEFEIWANAANDNLDAHDDSASGITGTVAVGCDALWYYVDADGDGWGEEETGVYSCDPLAEQVNQGADCDDENPSVNSGVAEVCNDIDDNCDEEVDEDFPKMLWVEDTDGDGFGSPTGMSKISCSPPAGYALGFEDCDDTNPNVNPDAVEMTNNLDDNCNGQRDEAPEPSGAGGAAATSSGTQLPPADGMGGAAATSTGPAASSGTQVPPGGGMGGAQAVPGEVPLPTASATGAPAPSGAPSGVPSPTPAEAGSSAGCALQQAPANAPAGVPALIAGLALLALGRRAQRR